MTDSAAVVKLEDAIAPTEDVQADITDEGEALELHKKLSPILAFLPPSVRLWQGKESPIPSLFRH